jgi:hypothetical protein
MTYTVAEFTVNNSWWWTEELSETCRVSFPKWIWEISTSSWFCYKDLSRCTVTCYDARSHVTMHGHMSRCSVTCHDARSRVTMHGHMSRCSVTCHDARSRVTMLGHMNVKCLCFRTYSRFLVSRNVHRLSETNASNLSHYYSWYDLCVLGNFRLWLAAVGSIGPPRKQRLFHGWWIWRRDGPRNGMWFLFWGFWIFTVETVCAVRIVTVPWVVTKNEPPKHFAKLQFLIAILINVQVSWDVNRIFRKSVVPPSSGVPICGHYTFYDWREGR